MEIKLNVRDEYQNLEIVQIKKIQDSLNNNLSVLFLNIRTDGNIGMIIRQSCIMGCRQVIICGRKSYDRRFTTGAHNYIDVNYWPDVLNVKIDMVSPGVFKETVDYNVEAFINRSQDFTLVFLEQGGTPINEVKWHNVPNPLLVLGNETLGIPRDFIKKIKTDCVFVSIPQYSVMRSMNVAMAASIAIWEINKIKGKINA
jgi:tRNA G18 (ribose-2'-O)-methylase SpoU